MRLLLIRHGQTPSNIVGALDTRAPGASLSPLGRIQAEAIPRALAPHQVSKVYATPRRRTQETARPLAEALGLDLGVLPGTEEVTAGDLEMRSDPRAIELYHRRLGAWMRGDLVPAVPGGEDGYEFMARYDAAVRAIEARHQADETVVLISHGAAIRVYVAARASNVDVTTVERGMENTGLAVLDRTSTAEWRLGSWQSTPLGGPALRDPRALDVTGEDITGADQPSAST